MIKSSSRSSAHHCRVDWRLEIDRPLIPPSLFRFEKTTIFFFFGFQVKASSTLLVQDRDDTHVKEVVFIFHLFKGRASKSSSRFFARLDWTPYATIPDTALFARMIIPARSRNDGRKKEKEKWHHDVGPLPPTDCDMKTAAQLYIYFFFNPSKNLRRSQL